MTDDVDAKHLIRLIEAALTEADRVENTLISAMLTQTLEVLKRSGSVSR